MKAKKIIISFLIASPLILTACPGGDKNVSGGTGNGNGDVVIPGGQPGTPIKQPNAFFNGLRHSENILYQKYWFTSQVHGNDLTYTDLEKVWKHGLTTFEIIARNQGRSVKEVKISFYNDIYAFAKNLQNLKLRERELRAYNNSVYEEFYAKTETLGGIFVVKRVQIYSDLLERSEEQLYKVGIQEVGSHGNVVVDHRQFSRNRRATIVKAIENAKTICDSLTTMFNDVNFNTALRGLHLRDCFSSPAVYVVSTLRNVNSMTKDEIEESINNFSADYSNGADTHVTPRVTRSPRPVARPRTHRESQNNGSGHIGDDLSAFDGIDHAPRVAPEPSVIPKPRTSQNPPTEKQPEVEDGPPTPPTSIRRRP